MCSEDIDVKIIVIKDLRIECPKCCKWPSMGRISMAVFDIKIHVSGENFFSEIVRYILNLKPIKWNKKLFIKNRLVYLSVIGQ